MNNTSEGNLIKYYDKSLGKYVIIDRKTGFSSYESVDEFHKQNLIHKQKEFFRQMGETPCNKSDERPNTNCSDERNQTKS